MNFSFFHIKCNNLDFEGRFSPAWGQGGSQRRPVKYRRRCVAALPELNYNEAAVFCSTSKREKNIYLQETFFYFPVVKNRSLFHGPILLRANDINWVTVRLGSANERAASFFRNFAASDFFLPHIYINIPSIALYTPDSVAPGLFSFTRLRGAACPTALKRCFFYPSLIQSPISPLHPSIVSVYFLVAY